MFAFRTAGRGAARASFQHKSLVLSTALFFMFLVGMLVLCGCPPSEPPEEWGEDEFTYEVALAPETTLVDEDDLCALVDTDSENHVYTFDAAMAAARELELTPGRNLIIHGLAVRKIAAVVQVGDDVEVSTEWVPLNEVISDGTLGWDYGVEFNADKVRAIEIEGYGKIAVKDGMPIDFTINAGDFTYRIEADLQTVETNLRFTVTKSIGGNVKGSFIVEGKLERFRSRDSVSFNGGELQDFDHALNGVKGDVTLELVVAGSGEDIINYKLPATIFSVPFAVGPIPVELRIKAQFVINASVPLDGSSRVTTGFTYDSDLGFSYNGTRVTNSGRLGSIDFEEDIHETGASTTISANFGVGFPRVELGIAKNLVVPWAQTAFLVGGSYTVYPACQTADATFLGAAGYDFSFFGIPLSSGSITFFEKTEPLLRAGDCPDDSKALPFLKARAALAYGLEDAP
jgi:hypothetical protein